MNAVPTLGQKVAKLITESPFKNPLNFHREIERKFGTDAISISHLYNVVNDKKRARDTVLYQIALSLGMEIYDLRKGTTSEPPDEGPSHGVYPYNKSAILYNLYHGLPFKPQMIKIKGKSKNARRTRRNTRFSVFYICYGNQR